MDSLSGRILFSVERPSNSLVSALTLASPLALLPKLQRYKITVRLVQMFKDNVEKNGRQLVVIEKYTCQFMVLKSKH